MSSANFPMLKQHYSQQFQKARSCNHCTHSRYNERSPKFKIQCSLNEVAISNAGECMQWEREPGVDDDI